MVYLYCSALLTGGATQLQTKDRGLHCIPSVTASQSSANLPCIYLIITVQQTDTALSGDAVPDP